MAYMGSMSMFSFTFNFVENWNYISDVQGALKWTFNFKVVLCIVRIFFDNKTYSLGKITAEHPLLYECVARVVGSINEVYFKCFNLTETNCDG